jgi:hypothetical protein
MVKKLTSIILKFLNQDNETISLVYNDDTLTFYIEDNNLNLAQNKLNSIFELLKNESILNIRFKKDETILKFIQTMKLNEKISNNIPIKKETINKI